MIAVVEGPQVTTFSAFRMGMAQVFFHPHIIKFEIVVFIITVDLNSSCTFMTKCNIMHRGRIQILAIHFISFF